MSADTERFSSRFRKERTGGGGGGTTTSRIRKHYEGGDTNDRESTVRTSSSGVSVTVGRLNRDRNETGGTKTESIADRMNKLKLNDKKEKDNDTPSDKEDNAKDEAEEDDQPKKTHSKREKGSAHAAKRKNRRNIREKRRSTGVVIMPSQPVIKLYNYTVYS